MAPGKSLLQNEILAIIDRIEQKNFILANAARMVYFAGFHKNEIEEIKIKDAFRNNAVLSQIEPFLPKGRKAYTSMTIILGPSRFPYRLSFLCSRTSRQQRQDRVRQTRSERGVPRQSCSTLLAFIITQEEHNEHSNEALPISMSPEK